MIQIDNLGVPRVGILNTFAGEYRDSVRFDYRVLWHSYNDLPDTFGIVYWFLDLGMRCYGRQVLIWLV